MLPVTGEPSNTSATSCPLVTRRTASRGDTKPISDHRGTCEYFQNRRESLGEEEKSTSTRNCGKPVLVPIVPVGRPVQAGNKWIDIKHCCVSPCNSPVSNLAGLTLSELSLGMPSGITKMTQDKAFENGDENCEALTLNNEGDQYEKSHDCDTTGRLKNRTHTTEQNQHNQRKLSCADTAEDIFCKATLNGRFNDEEMNDAGFEKSGELESPDANNNGASGVYRSLSKVKPCVPRSLCQAPVIESLTDLVAELHHIFESDHVNVDDVEFIMKSYKSNPAEWRNYAKFDKFKYTRNLVDAGNDKFNLMILCWGEGHGSSVHDHADAHCFMKMLDGALTETRFHWPATQEENEQPLKVMGKSQLQLNDVCYINDSLGLHRVENSSYSDRAVSLHLYSPPFNACSVFNERTGHKSISRVTFWSKFGKRDKQVGLFIMERQGPVPQNTVYFALLGK